MVGLNTQRLGQIGVNVVERVVLRDWKSRWQQIDSQNDDGVDGLIFLEHKSAPTGQIIFAQVKCQSARLDQKKRICLSVDRQRLIGMVDRWRRVVGAAILIHVNPKTLKACWVDLRNEETVGQTQIYVPSKNILDKNSRTEISALCGNLHRDLHARLIHTVAADFSHLFGNKQLQASARSFYRQLQKLRIRLADDGPEIDFTRAGWRHITRPDRPVLTRWNSLVLLGVLQRVLQQTPEAELRKFQSKKLPDGDYVSARAVVAFPFRQTAAVKIVLRRSVENSVTRYSFHTIYEPRRRRNALGAKVARGATLSQ